MQENDVIGALAALAHPVRLKVFRALVVSEPQGLTPGVMQEGLGVPAATLSFHLKELANAGLLASRQDGRYIYYSANYAQMNALIAFLTDNCCARDGCRPACGPARKSTQRSKS